MKVVQLSDPHLFADANERLRGVPTAETFREVVQHVQAHHADADRVIVTGDLAEDPRVETYRLLQDELKPWGDRVRVVPGNHDEPGAVGAALKGIFRIDAPKLGFVDGDVDWALVGLDSHLEGEDGGEVGKTQLDWLDDVLLSMAGRSIALFVHHPPVSVGTAWLDKMGLHDADALRSVLRRHPTIRAIFHGHIHAESEGEFEHAQVYGAPSTAYQLKLGGVRSESEAKPPGYRVIELGADTVDTEVVRLDDLRYPPKPKPQTGES